MAANPSILASNRVPKFIRRAKSSQVVFGCRLSVGPCGSPQPTASRLPRSQSLAVRRITRTGEPPSERSRLGDLGCATRVIPACLAASVPLPQPENPLKKRVRSSVSPTVLRIRGSWVRGVYVGSGGSTAPLAGFGARSIATTQSHLIEPPPAVRRSNSEVGTKCRSSSNGVRRRSFSLDSAAILHGNREST